MAWREIFTTAKACTMLEPVMGAQLEQYRTFKAFLEHNHAALQCVADLERKYHSGEQIDGVSVRVLVNRLLLETRGLATNLMELARNGEAGLLDALAGIEAALTSIREPAPPLREELTLSLEFLCKDMEREIGGKAANLAVLRNELGLPVPDGFVVTASAFRLFLHENSLPPFIDQLLEAVDVEDAASLEHASRRLMAVVRSMDVPASLGQALRDEYEHLAARLGRRPRLAVRSSAVGEDSAASFAGQYRTELNVGPDDLLEAWREVVASKYTPRAIAYRIRHGLDDGDAPMSVLALVMVDAVASGVLYTRDPAGQDAMLLAGVLGLGEQLVSGEASADEWLLDRRNHDVLQARIADKRHKLMQDDEGGVRLAVASAEEAGLPALPEAKGKVLAAMGMRCEEWFGAPQDIEWALTSQGALYLLQSRPVHGIRLHGAIDLATAPPPSFAGHPLLTRGGDAASLGCRDGVLFVAGPDRPARTAPDNSILVTRVASPDLAELAGRIRGIVTEVGSAACHLASVAREFGIPMLVNVPRALEVLPHGETATLLAEPPAIYAGSVQPLLEQASPERKHIYASPAHVRLRAMLDLISPLTLTDPSAGNFRPAGCKTVHDVIRYCHEVAMREMFDMSRTASGSAQAVKIVFNIPMELYVIDLGGGLRQGLTSCDVVRPEHITSVPLAAFWGGLSHPGITWQGTVPLTAGNLLTLMAESAMRPEHDMPGGKSYVLAAHDYMNCSAKFGYHFSNLDAFCGVIPENNYFSLQFAGGAGSYAGKSLRVAFLADVLNHLGFKVDVNGDLLNARIAGLPCEELCRILDQTGRLLACSRLLDMAISSPAQALAMRERFFREEYDLLGSAESAKLDGFYTYFGNWRDDAPDKKRDADTTTARVLIQDGKDWGDALSTGAAAVATRLIGKQYQTLLDNIEAYFYFPLAIAKDSRIENGCASVEVQPVAGKIDRAAGLAFGIRNIGNYFVLRVNALEDNCILFEFIDNKRFQREEIPLAVPSDEWRHLEVRVEGATIIGSVDGVELLRHEAAAPVRGHVGLWTKADSVSRFRGLSWKGESTASSTYPPSQNAS